MTNYIDRAEAIKIIGRMTGNNPSIETFIKAGANSVATQMSAVYERKKRAWETLNSSNMKTGKLDISKIAKYKTSDNIFQKKSNMKDGSNHGLTIVVDWSSSMSHIITEMSQQLLVIMLYCKKSNIKFQLYFFTGCGDINTITAKNEYVFGENEPSFMFKKMLTHDNSVSDIQTFVLNMTLSMRQTFCKIKSDITIPLMSGTPLQEAAIAAYMAAQEFKNLHDIENNSIMFITDGESGDQLYNVTLIDPYSNRQYDSIPGKDLMFQINMMCRDAGFKVFNIYIGDILNLSRIERGCENSVNAGKIYTFARDNKSSVFSIEDYYYYNEYICIGFDLIKNYSHNIESLKKTYSQIGNIINEILCRSFKIK